jgi:hypothetical protein
MITCCSQFDTAIVGLHEAIFNQESIDFNGLIEPAEEYSAEYIYLIIARFITQQGQGPTGLLHKPCFSH